MLGRNAMDNKDAQYLYNIEGCLRLRDYESVKAWLERARKSLLPKAFDEIVLTVAPLLEGIIGKEAAHPVIIEIRDQSTQIPIRLAAENRRKEEEKEEQRIQKAISYLDSNQIPYPDDVKRGDLPSFAENIKKRERLEEEKIRLLNDNHKSFLLRKGLDSDNRFLISLNTPNSRRITHCYSCKSHLDEAQHLNCSVCRWIVCPCGACGCGYKN